MLTPNDLKSWLQQDLTRLDKLLLILASRSDPMSPSTITSIASGAGFHALKKWNISAVLSASRGKAIRTDAGWELTDAGRIHLNGIGVSAVSPAALQVAADLRAHLSKLSDGQTKAFVEEAIRCHEAGLYRSAVVMSWLGAMAILHHEVQVNHLAAFNAEASRVFGSKWKTAVSTDDLGLMKERDFLDRIEAISIIGKNVKAELKTCLDRRNGCGHPNSFKISTNQSAAHLEILLLNVFEKFTA
ncbi:hypothetical protein [Shinella sumterensis]|uniref:hypothetical protein n=1 Tax=Shinella sumterensis TaxID=1967501 RepID=UPI003F863CAA